MQKTRLKNGIRILTVENPSSPTVTFSISVKAGGRNEKESELGLAHFIEHNFFKGSKKYPTFREVFSAIEGVGGETNAFTSNEITSYYAKASKDKLGKLVDVVSDAFLNPLFPEEAMEKEKNVIFEEINMYENLPSRKVVEELTKLAFKGTPLGNPVIGLRETLKKFKRDNLVEFINNGYGPQNLVITVSGSAKHKDTVELISKYFDSYQRGSSFEGNSVNLKREKPGVVLFNKPLDQGYFALSFYGLSLDHPDYYTLQVADTILGGGASSRIFSKIREEQGLAYTISSASHEYTDTGIWLVAGGVTIDKIYDAIKMTLEEFKNLSEKSVSKHELKRAKEYIKGNMYMSVESSDGLGGFYSYQELLQDRVLSPEEKALRIDTVTDEDVLRISKDLVKQENINLSVVGPYKDKEKFQSILNL